MVIALTQARFSFLFDFFNVSGYSFNSLLSALFCALEWLQHGDELGGKTAAVSIPLNKLRLVLRRVIGEFLPSKRENDSGVSFPGFSFGRAHESETSSFAH